VCESRVRGIGERSASVQHIQKKKAGSIAAPLHFLRPQRAFRLSSRHIIRSLAQTKPTRSRHLRGFWPYREKLSARRLRLLAMMLHVVLRRFRCVMRGMVKVTLSGMRVVRGRLVVALFVMSCRCAMMARRVFVMFRCFVMMLCRLLRHSSSSFYC